ncbi:DUF4303 domain-containing protein [Aquimarina sp. 2201CG14-23]|uniref:DUF4303 domain-containing protein n=1 Tax=Aquimarina mycalae TaxID=3040073 RepID=UPI002477F876|nr:DUF4303 domain-containing protein [Aquimarina sp. 2201CG14-23]MDH7447643.1 DUF4303 domain-containing protein [Aquimarina sp. 2201CG14-23]
MEIVKNMDFNALKQQIKKVTKRAFLENVAKYGKEICAFALVSDDGAMTVVPYTNTIAHLQKMQKDDPDYKEVYEFEPAEWYTSDGANDEIDAICSVLNKEVLRDNINFEVFKNQLFETCVQVLEELQKENFFMDNVEKDILVLFSISDTNEPEENLIKWAKRTNIKTYGEAYEAYQNKVW